MAAFTSSAQKDDSSIIEVTNIRFFKQLFTEASIAIAPRDISSLEVLNLNYKKGLLKKYQLSLPGDIIENSAMIQFTVSNNSDTLERLYFLPGFYTRKMSVFKADYQDLQGTISRVPDSLLRNISYQGSIILTIYPGDTTVFFIQMQMLRTSSNNFYPRLIEIDYLKQWLQWKKSEDYPQDVVTYVASGILLLMIFYSLAVYMQNRNREFIYYSAYAVCTFILLFFKSLLNIEYTRFNFFFEEYLDFMVMVSGIFFYLIFVRKFLETQEKHKVLHRFMKRSQIALIALQVIYSIIYFLTDKYVILNVMENYIIKLLLFIIGIIFIIYSIKRRNTLLNYLAAGNIALVLFSIVSFCLMIFKWKIVPEQGHILNRSMVYYEIGLVLELTFFLSGLAYKNRRDLIEQVKERERYLLDKERQDFEKQMAVMAAQQEERDRISADMHDELGSGVTAIRLMSEIVKSKMKGDSLPEIEKISHSANELLGKMDTIIWTMKSSNDSLESLAVYIRAYAIEYFDSTPISCAVYVSIISNVEVSGEKRRNIFLSAKEALTNIMKHAQATTVQIDIIDQPSKLLIRITDNGKGIDLANLRRFGNGLSNMKRRMQSVSGEFSIGSENGTILTFEIPL